MKAVRYHRQGGPEVLQVDEVEKPSPGVGELLVEIKAAGVNPVDTYLRQSGAEYVPDSLPMVPGGDFAGVVEAIGAGVTGFEVGDRVFTATGKARQGGLAEYIAVPAYIVAKLPDGVSFEQGAGVGNAGGTAWHVLVDRTHLEPGHVCLIHGGSGGVGHIASQIAAAGGATVIATAGSKESCDRLEEFGVDVALEYHRDDLEAAIAEAAPEGVDIVIDHFPHEYFDLNVSVAAKGAHIVIYDKTHLSSAAVHSARGKDLTVRFTSFGPAGDKRTVFQHLGRLLASGDLRVEIANRYSLEEAAAAHRDVIEGGYVGRLLVIPG